MISISSKIRPYWSQSVAVFTASLGAISNGMEFGWTSPAVPLLQVTLDEVFWLQTLYIIGGVCGLPLTFILLQRIGRKKSLLVSQSAGLLCWILVATSSGNIPQLYAARFLSGFVANCMFVGMPMYTAEITEPAIRGLLGSFVYTASIFGVLVAYCVIPYIPIYASSAFAATICFLMITTFMWQPESPYYLLLKSKKDEAKRELQRLRYTSSIDEELEEISKAVDRQNSERGRPIDLLIVPSNLKATLIMTILNTAQNMCGMTVIIMNAQSIIHASGTVISDELTAVAFAVTMFVSAVIGTVLIDKFGRKFLIISSCLISSVFLAILAGYFIMKDENLADVSGYEWVPFFATVAYAFAFKYGMGLVPIVITAELFPTSVKSMGMVLADMWFTVMATVSLKMYHSSLETIGMYFPFVLFAVFGVLTAVIVLFYVPETKGKSLEEIQMILKGKDKDVEVTKEDVEKI